MSPIQKVQARSAALDALGLAGSASPQDIRGAWKRLAFETHPDKSAGETSAFLKAKTAFEYLGGSDKGFGAEGECEIAFPGAAGAPRRPSARPIVAARREQLSEDEIREARALMAQENMEEATDHVARVLERRGRTLLYFVPGAAARGVNRVALPAAVLASARKVRPKILTFELATASIKEFVVPDEMRLAMFPGARSVRICFEDTSHSDRGE